MTNLFNLTLLTFVGISVFVLISSEATAGIVEDENKGVGLTGFEKKKHDLDKRQAEVDAGDSANEDEKPAQKKKGKKKKATTASPSKISTSFAPDTKGSKSATTTSTPGHHHKSTQKSGHASKSTTNEPGHSGSTTSKPEPGGSTTEKPEDHDGSSTTKGPNHDESTTTTQEPDTEESDKPPCSGHGRKSARCLLKEARESDKEYLDRMNKVKAAEKALLVKAQDAVRDWVSHMESNGKKSMNPGEARSLFLDMQSIRQRYFSGRRRIRHRPKGDGIRRYLRPIIV